MGSIENELSILNDMPKDRAIEYIKICTRYKLDFRKVFAEYLAKRKNGKDSYKRISKFSFEQFCIEKFIRSK